MAYFLMWMASFFKMAIFWKFMDLAWFTRKDEDFLLVQREHHKKLCKDMPRLEKCLRDMEASSKKKILNKNQCIHLFGKLILVMKGIEKILSSATKDLKFQSIFKELCYLQKKIEIVEKNCTKQDRWCHLAIFQLQNKETFREFLLDLKCCYNVACEKYLLCHPNQSINILPIHFDATTYEQVLEDGQILKRRLELVLQREASEDYEIAQHLLLSLRNLDRVGGGDLNALEVPIDFNKPKFIQKIGTGSCGNVYKSNWSGLECATKVLEGNFEFLINSRKEAGILACLSHPNLVQFFGCGTNKNLDVIVEKGEIGEMYLVMELMDSSLSSILKEEKNPLPYHLAIDIMHQIAKGVYYLHDMQVAHLDLKPDNVLSSSMSMEEGGPCRIFKITDYGTSQLEVCNNPKNPKPSEYTVGTLRYMAPEVIAGSKTPLHPFRADAWSFAMICSQILCRKIPYFGLKPKDLFDQFSCTHDTSTKILRPDLPNNCKELTNLIQECWAQNPLQRPTFSEICERLASLKKSFLRGTYSYKMVPQFGSSYTFKKFKDSKSIMDHVPKVDEQIAPPKKVIVDLEHQLSIAKELLKMNYVGIVGMGGIGKTTLAKAIFEDAKVNSSYHLSCFIAQSKNYQSSYEILCEILPKLGSGQKPRNLGDAQRMMKKLFVEKKVLLILDDIKDESQVHDVVPKDIIEASKGSSIILTTRDWSTIKSFVDIKGRLDVELLNEKAATILFTTHLSWNVASLSPDFVNLRKHVVKACNGLPLSLKVMGAFLRHKERLRSWERALQRMARGRSLDGDEEIWNTLKISYDGLINEVEKKMFLDVACFFCKDVYPFGISKETILLMWSKDGILPVGELERLIDMSLLKVNKDGCILEMHDQLRDMGRKIANGTRIWKESMIPESKFPSKDAKVLEGISWQGTISHYLPLVKDYQSVDFKNLRVLILVSTLSTSQARFDNMDVLLRFASQCLQLEAILIGNSNEDGYLQNCSESMRVTLNQTISDLCGRCASLKILDLIGIPFLKQLPNNCASSNTLKRLNLSSSSSLEVLPKEVKNLIALNTLILKRCSSLATLPKEVGNLSSLTNLNLGYCTNLTTLPKEVGNLSSLTALYLSGCSSLVSLPKEVGNLSSLTVLNLSYCSNLTIVPKELGNLSSLITLNLRRCPNLATLPKEFGNLSSLKVLYLRNCSSLVALPNEVGNMSSLTTLNLRECSNLATLPKEVGSLSSLTTLNLRGCSKLKKLPKEVGNLSFLTTLDLFRCSSLVTIPKKVGNLSSLTTLDLRQCSNLKALPKEVENLSCLTRLDFEDCSSLVVLPNEMRKLSSLTTLNFKGCSSLEALTKDVGYLSSLTTLNLRGCLKLATLPKEIGNLSFLITLNLRCCSSLIALQKEVGNLTCLTTLDLGHCPLLTTLPKEVGNLSSLTTLDLKGCSNLVTLPNEVENLSSLTTLNLRGCSNLIALPKEVGNLSSLTTLNLRGCSNLIALPKEVGNLSSLTTLNLEYCRSLVALPKDVGNGLSSLITFHLGYCTNLVVLPQEVGSLTCLTTLDLRYCENVAALPKEVGNLICLTTLDLRYCKNLRALPNEVGNLTSLTTLDLRGCSILTALPNEVGNMISLTNLNLRGCSRLETLPNEVKNLSFLTNLEL